jgi:hypothetical protein
MRWNLVFLVLGLGALGWLAWQVGPGEIAAGMGRVGWTGFAVICAVQLASLLLDAVVLRLCAGTEPPVASYWSFARASIAGHAINTLTPLGQLGEVTKYTQLESELPGERVAGALLLQNLVFFAGAAALVGASGVAAALLLPLDGAFRIALLVISAAFLAMAAATLVFMYRGPGPAIFRLAERLASRFSRLGKAVAWVRRVEGLSRGATTHSRRMVLVWVLAIVSRLCGTVEVGVILAFIGYRQGLVIVLLTQGTGQLVTWATAFVPFQAGTAEGGSYLLFKAIGLTPSVGVLLEIVRKARRLAVAAFGMSLLGAETLRKMRRSP